MSIETLSSRTIDKWTPCGAVYTTIVEKEPGVIDYIRLVGPTQDDNCGGSFYEAMADMLTFACRRIRNKHDIKAIIKNLKHHRCNRVVANKDHIVSCSDAIGKALEQYFEGYK